MAATQQLVSFCDAIILIILPHCSAGRSTDVASEVKKLVELASEEIAGENTTMLTNSDRA